MWSVFREAWSGLRRDPWELGPPDAPPLSSWLRLTFKFTLKASGSSGYHAVSNSWWSSIPCSLLLCYPVVDWKKVHNLKVENYVLFHGLPEKLSLENSFSHNSEGLLWRGKGGDRILGVLAKKKKKKEEDSWNVKRWLLKKVRHLKVKKISTFLCIGRCKSLGSLESSLWSAP